MFNSPTDEKNQIKDKARDISATLREGKQEIKDGAAEVTKVVSERVREGQESVKQLAVAVEKQLRKDPWPVVAGIAIGSLLVGFVLGSSRRN